MAAVGRHLTPPFLSTSTRRVFCRLTQHSSRTEMATSRPSSSVLFRSAVATHVSLTATSLLCCVLGSSDLPSHHTHKIHESSPASTPTTSNNVTCASSALLWLEQLHTIITCMYVGGGTCREHNYRDNVMVEINQDASFENPWTSYEGLGEIERVFRARTALHPLANERRTMLECINVKASEDSMIASGEGTVIHQHIGDNEVSNRGSCSPPTVEVSYRLTQTYGAFFSMHSILVVTVQVRSGCQGREIHKHSVSLSKLGIPLATSSCTGSVANTSQSQSLVAEVVRIEEQWNGVQLLHLSPFHWSRRLNGMMMGSAMYCVLSVLD